MASLLSNQQQQTPEINTLLSVTCSSRDHLPLHRISSHDPMSRSLDTSLDLSLYRARFNRTVISSNFSVDLSDQDTIQRADMGLKAPDNKHVKMVPFKWEEAPGKPINTVSCNELVPYKSSSLQLPPKLQCQNNQSPLHSTHSSPFNSKIHAFEHDKPTVIKHLTKPMNQSLFRSSPNRKVIQRLYKYMLKTTSSCSGQTPLHKFVSQSWHFAPPCIQISNTTLHHHYKQKSDKLSFNDRFFFDRLGSKDVRHCASMDSTLPVFDPSSSEDEFVSRKALSFSAMEEHEQVDSNSTASSPWQPLSFHEMESIPNRPWQHTPIKVYHKLQEDIDECDDDDDDGDDSFHSFFSTSSSMKPSKRIDCNTVESTCSSPSPWYLDFSPAEEEVQVERKGNKLIVRLVALIKLKRVISRFKRKIKGANHQAESNMWSPALATYLYNEKEEEIQKERTQQSSSTLKQGHGNCGEDDGCSEMGSNRLHIDPNYYLPARIRTHIMSSHCYYSDEEDYMGRRDPYYTEEEETKRQKVTLREQLDDSSEDEFQHPFAHAQEAKTPLPCKGMCKVSQTVKVLVSTIKLFLVHTEIGKKRRQEKSSHNYTHPNLTTNPTFSFRL